MKTAVEYLVEEFKQRLTGENLPNWVIEIIEQAKEMEKEQIENAFNYGVYDGGGLIKKYKMSGEQYYNETFKSE